MFKGVYALSIAFIEAKYRNAVFLFYSLLYKMDMQYLEMFNPQYIETLCIYILQMYFLNLYF